jgi:type VI secretion system secreted protein Hcp
MAFDTFLKISTIPGESTDDKHKDWIEILSFNTGMVQQASGSVSTGGARSAERVDHHDFSVVKTLDKASPKLALASCTGEHIPEVNVELCRATGDKAVYMKYKMTDVLVSSAAVGGSAQGGETLPLEEVSFNYAKINWIYTETDHKTGKAKGDVETHWDLSANKGA